MGSAFSLSARAQSTTEKTPTWTLGIGAVWSPSPYRNYDNKAWPLPMINYEGKSFFVHGATLGYRLFNTGSDDFSIIASPLGNRFVHNDTRDPQLRQLSDRDISGLAGVAWRHHAEWGVIQASAQKEFTGHGSGSVVDANYSYPIAEGSLTLIPTAGAAYYSADLDNYYYGISGSDALRSGLPFYHAGGGAQPYFGITATYRVSHSWQVTGGLRYTVLPDAIKNSPMVDAGHTQSYFIALSHIF